MRAGLATAANAAAATDDAFSLAYRKASVIAEGRSHSFDEYAQAMRPWNRAQDASTALRVSLFAAESALDAGDQAEFLAVIGCVADSVRQFAEALDRVGVRIPASLAKARHALRDAPSCGVSL
jgi:hypothetical protein